jgi:hypothetical protein
MSYFGLAQRPGAGRFFDRLPVHRSESPPGYSSAGCSPAEPASALPGVDMIAHSRPAMKNRLTRRAPYKGGKAQRPGKKSMVGWIGAVRPSRRPLSRPPQDEEFHQFYQSLTSS